MENARGCNAECESCLVIDGNRECEANARHPTMPCYCDHTFQGKFLLGERWKREVSEAQRGREREREIERERERREGGGGERREGAGGGVGEGEKEGERYREVGEG